MVSLVARRLAEAYSPAPVAHSREAHSREACSPEAHSREACSPAERSLAETVERARENTWAGAFPASGKQGMAASENWAAVAVMAVEAWNPYVRPASSSHMFLKRIQQGIQGTRTARRRVVMG